MVTCLLLSGIQKCKIWVNLNPEKDKKQSEGDDDLYVQAESPNPESDKWLYCVFSESFI